MPGAVVSNNLFKDVAARLAGYWDSKVYLARTLAIVVGSGQDVFPFQLEVISHRSRFNRSMIISSFRGKRGIHVVAKLTGKSSPVQFGWSQSMMTNCEGGSRSLSLSLSLPPALPGMAAIHADDGRTKGAD